MHGRMRSDAGVRPGGNRRRASGGRRPRAPANLAPVLGCAILLVMRPLRSHRGITTWLAIVGYVLVASGLPLPLGVMPPAGPGSAAGSGTAKRLAAKDRSRPFPCMDKPCGCASAEQCFTRCCCNTPAETLAWARTHGVEPAVLAALERRVGPVSAESFATTVPVIDTVSASEAVHAADVAGCCAATKARASCCNTTGDRTAAGCGGDETPVAVTGTTEAGRSAGTASGSSRHEPNEPPRSRGLSLRAMLVCGGIVAEWFAAGASLPPPAPELSEILVMVERRESVDRAAVGLRAAPDAPPPRAA